MEPRFIADTMLGRLATWLRVIGCDVAYLPDLEDERLLAISREEGRLILTRDTLLVQRRAARDNHFFVRGDDFREQLRQVVAAFAIDPEKRFLSRCLRCNEPLEEIEKETVAGLVPPYVFATQESFRRCPACGRLYWGASHRDAMAGQLKEILSRP